MLDNIQKKCLFGYFHPFVSKITVRKVCVFRNLYYVCDEILNDDYLGYSFFRV